MTFASVLPQVASELALFSAVGFLLFAVNDLAVDFIYIVRRLWRSATIYRRYPRAFGRTLAEAGGEQRFIAIFVPAWDESTVIGAMLRATVDRLDYGNYRIFVGHYRNDVATAAAISSVDDPRIEPVLVDEDGPTTKADCLNHLYGISTTPCSRSSCAATARPPRLFFMTPRIWFTHWSLPYSIG